MDPVTRPASPDAAPRDSIQPPTRTQDLTKIFICCRREDSGPAARHIYDHPEHHFARGQVSMDVDDTPLGVDWRDWLDRQIRQYDLVLAVMGRHWLTLEEVNRLPRPNLDQALMHREARQRP
ncbi:MAG: TIR domain-containing protein [Chromatiaceae bacterium]|nr:MAG: TIR domain-containing protein [Chromatiaceae bacterium]